MSSLIIYLKSIAKIVKPKKSDFMQINNKNSKFFKSSIVIKAIQRFKNDIFTSKVKVNSTILNFS